ncbi:MAG TPA: hypothetical protein V6D20_17550, partial [Candidatus Obscuribacterales bacterium]
MVSSSAAPYHPHCTDGWTIPPPVSCCLAPSLQADGRCRELEPNITQAGGFNLAALLILDTGLGISNSVAV